MNKSHPQKAEYKKPETKEYILCDFVYSSRAANYATVLEVKIVVTLERREVKFVGLASNCKGAQRNSRGFGNCIPRSC